MLVGLAKVHFYSAERAACIEKEVDKEEVSRVRNGLRALKKRLGNSRF